MKSGKVRFFTMALVLAVMAFSGCAMMEGNMGAMADGIGFDKTGCLSNWFDKLHNIGSAEGIEGNTLIPLSFDPESQAGKVCTNPATYKGTLMDPANDPKIKDVKIEGNVATGKFYISQMGMPVPRSFKATFRLLTEGETKSDGTPKEYWGITSFQIFEGETIGSGKVVFSM